MIATDTALNEIKLVKVNHSRSLNHTMHLLHLLSILIMKRKYRIMFMHVPKGFLKSLAKF